MRLVLLVIVAILLAGCSTPEPEGRPPGPVTRTDADTYADLGFDGETWPRLDGVTLTILDHGAFGAFDDAKKRFEELTGAKVEHVEADDSGGALNRAVREKGDPTFDVIYGIDNVLWTKAVREGIFEPYTPHFSTRIDPALVFFEANGTWHATPVDHGYIGVNVDERALGASVASLDDLKAHASEFATPDPRTSTPGLGFLLATIATYGEAGSDDCERDVAGTRVCAGWQAYWAALFEGGVLITSGWTEAYEQHFSGGYGADMGGLGDKAIVTSYTESPAYEAFFGRAADTLATPLVAPNSTFHQIQTMGIAKGTDNLAAAQAWIEFALTDEFQSLAAPGNAVYPVVNGVSTQSTYGDLDPAPGTFEPAAFTAEALGANIERWLREWTDLCEQHDCA